MKKNTVRITMLGTKIALIGGYMLALSFLPGCQGKEITNINPSEDIVNKNNNQLNEKVRDIIGDYVDLMTEEQIDDFFREYEESKEATYNTLKSSLLNYFKTNDTNASNNNIYQVVDHIADSIFPLIVADNCLYDDLNWQIETSDFYVFDNGHNKDADARVIYRPYMYGLGNYSSYDRYTAIFYPLGENGWYTYKNEDDWLIPDEDFGPITSWGYFTDFESAYQFKINDKWITIFQQPIYQNTDEVKVYMNVRK
ncbi:MAG: hypothetical protein ACOXZW_02650 [Bacilli bacterium]|jgi:hypothetical protein|nr:hypothetical protein [Bacilli bacterium]